MSSKIRVAVLMGGTSAERNVSLLTGTQILNALDPAKYAVYALDTESGRRFLPDAASGGSHLPNVTLEQTLETMTAADNGSLVESLVELPRVQSAERPDVVFIALHGPGGEDGTVQGMLEVLGVPYTGSGVLASALAMDKAMSKCVLTAHGVKMPQDVTLRGLADLNTSQLDSLIFPVIVKPNAQGSSFGMTIVDERTGLDNAVEAAFKYDGTVLVEQFIKGKEISVPVIGNNSLEALPIVEIIPSGGLYDYAAKYTPGATEEIVPARISAGLTEQAQEIARVCHRALGCRGMSRTDMIVTDDGVIYTLEVNSIPGMTPTSLLPRSAQAAGIAFPELLNRLITLALEGRGYRA